MDFKTIEGAMEIFRNLNCIGNDNCIFVTFKDTNREGFKYGALGAVGGAIAGAAAFSNGMLNGIEGFDGLLINCTELGLGIVPLKSNGVQLVLKVEKMEPQLDRFVFISNENIDSIIIKNFSFLNKKTQKVKIKIKGGKTLHQLARKVEKTIPYQEENFAKFMDICKNGKIEHGSSVQDIKVNNAKPENNQQINTNINSDIKNEQNLINNKEEKDRFANMAINLLITNNIISDYNGISCEYGYLYLIEGHGYEGLFKIKKMDKIYYFAVQGTNIEMVNLDENGFSFHAETFLNMHKN